MTITLTHISKTAPHPMPNTGLDEIADRIAVNDHRSSLSSVADIAFLQGVIHLTSNTKAIGGQQVNIFDGRAHGHFGLYGDLAQTIYKDGRFRLSADGNLPWVTFGKDGADAQAEFRQNENPVLAAIHLTWMRLHNARMDVHGDEAKAKREVVSAINKALLAITVRLTGIEAGRVLDIGRNRAKFVNTFEWVMAVGRLPHVQVSAKFKGNLLFAKMRAHEVPLRDLLDEDAGRPGLRIVEAMGHGEKNLIQLTHKTRPVEHKLCDCRQLAQYFGMSGGAEGVPIWSGLLEEAETSGGKWGPIASTALAAGFGGMLIWAQGNEGVYYAEDDGVPETLREMVEAVW